MYRSRSKSLAVFLLYVVGVVVFSKAHASALTATAPTSPQATHAEARHCDLIGLARAYQDLVAAESSLSANPSAAASFGPLLREARARLEAGLAAEREASGGSPQIDSTDTAAPTNTAMPSHRRARVKHLIWV